MAMMSALDETVENITAALERTGLLTNTLLVFASDNGGVVGDHGSNVPLRGGKFSNWEGEWHLL
jgi:arylsulfatase A-like enzyme